MNLSKSTQDKLEGSLTKIKDYNCGLCEKPNVPMEELRDIRRYQAWKLENQTIFASGTEGATISAG